MKFPPNQRWVNISGHDNSRLANFQWRKFKYYPDAMKSPTNQLSCMLWEFQWFSPTNQSTFRCFLWEFSVLPVFFVVGYFFKEVSPTSTSSVASNNSQCFEKDVTQCIPGTCLSSIFGFQPSKTRSFPIKTRVIWVPGIFRIVTTH